MNSYNRGRSSGLLFGRYKGDRYVSGGAYYFCTFGAAEYYYRLAAAIPSKQPIVLWHLKNSPELQCAEKLPSG